MLERASNWLRYALERFILRGPLHRLLFIAVAIIVIASGAGLLVLWTSPAFESPADAVWWAFLRLTDPGYLGDDEGLWVRTVSTVVTVLGYVLFLGALIAIMTQWLNQTMSGLQRGLTPVVARNHIVVLGWTPRTATIVRQLLLSEERIRRFLRLHRTGRLQVAVLAEELGPIHLQELKEEVGDRYNDRQLILRSGFPLELEHLHRVDFLNAAVAILPLAEAPEELDSSADPETIKTLRSISHAAALAGRKLPLVVAEIAEARNRGVAARAYNGPVEVLASDQLVARLLSQSIRHPGFPPVCSQLLSHEVGSELYVHELPELEGLEFGALAARFERAIPIGLVREDDGIVRSYLNPPPGTKVLRHDHMVTVARTFADVVTTSPRPTTTSDGTALPADPAVTSERPHTLLILGWSRRLPALLHELEQYREGSFEVDLLTLKPPEAVQRALDRQAVSPRRLSFRQVIGDRTALADLQRLPLGSYDTVLILAGDVLPSEQESDARTVTTCLLLRELYDDLDQRPTTVAELLHEENAALLDDGPEETLVSSVIISHILSQVGLRRELSVVFDELFGHRGGEICLRLLDDHRSYTFAELAGQAGARGEIAIGLTIGGRPQLNPAPDSVWPPGSDRRLVVIATA